MHSKLYFFIIGFILFFILMSILFLRIVVVLLLVVFRSVLFVKGSSAHCILLYQMPSWRRWSPAPFPPRHSRGNPESRHAIRSLWRIIAGYSPYLYHYIFTYILSRSDFLHVVISPMLIKLLCIIGPLSV